ncbi:glucosaminidase domain-containing protein [Flammeovirga sp. SubArs3]|uniref:glucosaminidase domain-containing protein n=1 Tax=Flammeovirga sp. SubArs3 TaxID=2995316 RepID=UPI00248B0F17|nr:glucosaminidase domain-containing protein [Flammeovirga sp. SubArs3]
MRHLFLWAFSVLSFMVNAANEPGKIDDSEKETTYVYIDSYTQLDSVFKSYALSIDKVRGYQETLPIFVHNIQPSIKDVNGQTKIDNFIMMILSSTLEVNNDILSERRQLNQLLLSGKTEQSKDIQALLKKYRAKNIEELKVKLLPLPPSLVIAQAIVESGWGTSRFAIEGNALFGKHTKKGSPNSMPAAAANIALQSYESIYAAVSDYELNINTHPAYKKLRDTRIQANNNNIPVDGIDLVNALKHYSETGDRYIQTITKVISIYHLNEFDHCKLKNTSEVIVKINK